MSAYKSDLCAADHIALQRLIAQLGQTGGRIVSVTWLPERTVYEPSPSGGHVSVRAPQSYLILHEPAG